MDGDKTNGRSKGHRQTVIRRGVSKSNFDTAMTGKTVDEDRPTARGREQLVRANDGDWSPARPLFWLRLFLCIVISTLSSTH